MGNQPTSPPSCDVLIVGTGPTGALVAQRMAANGLSVVMLEAGQRFGGQHPLPNSEGNAGKIMRTEPRNHVGGDFVVPKTGENLVNVGSASLVGNRLSLSFSARDADGLVVSGVAVVDR